MTTESLVVKRVSFTRIKLARQEGSHTFIDDCSPVLAVQGCTLYDVVLSISPVQALCGIVDGQTIGPEQGGIGNNCAETAVHPCSFNLGCLAPVCPEQRTATEKLEK